MKKYSVSQIIDILDKRRSDVQGLCEISFDDWCTYNSIFDPDSDDYDDYDDYIDDLSKLSVFYGDMIDVFESDLFD